MSLQRLTITPEQVQGSIVTLTPEQVHYLRQVLRLRSGDEFLVLYPQGGVWRSRLQTDPHLATVIDRCPDGPELPLQTTLLLALPKTGFDEVIRQCVESGAATIVPILSDRTLLRPSDSKQKRWQRIAEEAAEQCERNTVPILTAPLPFLDGLKSIPAEQPRYFCLTRRSSPSLWQSLQRDRIETLRLRDRGELAIVIGPEGGWTDQEVEQALSLGYQPVSLGPLILRAVTAPIAAMSLVMAMSLDPN